MQSFWFLVWQTGIVVATTIGAGMFALPYVFKEAGWLTSVFYLIILSSLVAVAHYFYWRVLEKAQGEYRLVKLSADVLGKLGFKIAFIAVVGGLFLVLVIYLLLGARFLKLIFPPLNFNLALIVFWFLSSLFLLFKEKRIAWLEFGAVILMISAVVLTFLDTFKIDVFRGIPPINWENLFLPFGAILFSLTAWTAVGPVYNLGKNIISDAEKIFAVFGGGVFLAAAFYFLFVVGILGSATEITPDTLSGLVNWPLWKMTFLGFLGAFAVWTSYLPIGLEIRNSFEKDLTWPKVVSLGLVLFLPLLLIFLGIDNFLKVIELAGGLFLDVQYLLIFLVSRRFLSLNLSQKFFLDILAFIFTLAAVYEIYYFVVG